MAKKTARREPTLRELREAGYRFNAADFAAPQEAATEAPPEEPGFLRGAADVAIEGGQGLVQGVKMLTDVAGADNPVSQGLGGAIQGMSGLLSPYRQAEIQNRQRLIEEAKNSGSTWNEVGAYLGGFAENPLGTIANAAGTMVPTAAAMLVPGLRESAIASRVAGAGVGAAQGVGVAKGSNYEQVKNEALKAGYSEADAEAMAVRAQEYSLENLPGQALSAGLGAFAGSTGAEPLVRGLFRGTADKVPGVARRVGMGASAQAIPEGLQGGQEQLEANLASQRAGFDVPTMRGVAGSVALEAAAGGALGGALAVPRPRKLPEAGPLSRATNAGIDSGATSLGEPPGGGGPLLLTDQSRTGVLRVSPDGVVMPETTDQVRAEQQADDERVAMGYGSQRRRRPPSMRDVTDIEPKDPPGGGGGAPASTEPMIDRETGEIVGPTPAARGVERQRPEPTEDPRTDDILVKSTGLPFKNMRSAMSEAQRATNDTGVEHEIVRVSGGLAVRKTGASDGVAPGPDGGLGAGGAVAPADAQGSVGVAGRQDGAPDATLPDGVPADAAQAAADGTGAFGDAPRLTTREQPTTLGTKIDARPKNAPGFTAADVLPRNARNEAETSTAPEAIQVSVQKLEQGAPNAAAPAPAEGMSESRGETKPPVAAAPAEPSASWVIREKATGKVVAETFDKKKVDALNTDKYEAVPIREHLAGLNKQAPAPTPAAPKTVLERRRDAVLDKQTSENGKVMSRRQWVESKVAEGLKPAAKQEDKIKPMSRMQYFRATNEEQRAHERRIKEAGKKDVYWIGDYEVTKIEHDYAQSLLANKPANDPNPQARPEPQAQAPAGQAPEAARGDAAGTADVPAAGGAAAVEADGVKSPTAQNQQQRMDDARRIGMEAAQRGDPRDPPQAFTSMEKQVWRAGWDQGKKPAGPTPQVEAEPTSIMGLTDSQRRAAIDAETLEDRPDAPEVSQPTKGRRVKVFARTLNGVNQVFANLYEMPGYKGPQLAVKEYKTSRGQGYRVYLPKSGAFIADSNGVSSLDDTLKLAVLRIQNARQTIAARNAEPAPAPSTEPAATHKDPGEPAEPVTPAVIAEAVEKAAINRDRKPSEMRAELLAMVDEAIKEAPDYTDFQTAVASMGEKDAVAAFTTDARRGALGDKYAPTTNAKRQRTFKIVGDGTFTVNNTVRQLLRFKQRVASSRGFTASKSVPAMERASDALDSRSAATSIREFIDDGDTQAAVDYAAARGLDVAEVLKGDKARLGKVAGLTPTAEAVGEFEPEAAPEPAAPAQPAAASAARAESAARRINPVTTIDFAKPIVGPTGARLKSYTWQWKPMEFVDARGEERVKRISDWDASEASGDTGREVVHQFVVDDGGADKVVSAESALKLLGFTAGSDGKAGFTSLSSAAKTLARLRMQEAELQQAKEQFDRDKADVMAMSLPAMPTERDGKGWFNMGDASVRQIEPGAMTEERRRSLIGAWRDNRMAERGWRTGSEDTLRVGLRETADRIKRQQAKVDRLVGDAASAAPPAQQAEPAPVSSREGQMNLANRGARIASLRAMNNRLRQIAPEQAWADSNIENASNAELDRLQDQISAALVEAQRGPAPVNPLRAELEALSGTELRDLMGRMGLAGKLMTASERVDALLAEDPAEVRAAMQQAEPSAPAPAEPTTLRFPATAAGAVQAFNADDADQAKAIIAKLRTKDALREVGEGTGFRMQIGEGVEAFKKRIGEVAERLTKTAREQSARERVLYDKLMDRAMEYDRAADHAARAKANGVADDSTAYDSFYRPMGGGETEMVRIPELLERLAADVRSLKDDPDYAKVSAMVRQARPRVFDAADKPTLKQRADSMRRKPEGEKPAPAKIGDFGEKLEGARKDYAATLKDAMDVDVAAEPLSKSWPEPDYQKLLDGGADPYMVAFIHAARDELPTKPQKSWKLKGWVQQAEMLRGMAQKLLSGDIAADRVQEMLNKYEFFSLRMNVGSRAELYQLVGHGHSLKGITFAEHYYSVYRGEENVRKWVVEQKAKATAFSNWPRELAVADTKDEMLAQFKAKIDGLDLSRDAKKQPQFVIYRKRGQDGAFVGKKIGREYIDLHKAADLPAARAYLTDNTAALEAALEKYRDTPMERRAENQPRVGDDHRNGAPVTAEVFADTFGFRGVQFGNYVEQGRRQSDLNEAYDALMDMAAVLGVPPRALSLNGRLGLAFGARGKGGKNAAAAHFEPDRVVINLTKGGGPGSLAHEWWHSLDNYFSRESGDNSGFVTGGSKMDAIREEMRAAFNGVKRATQLPSLRQRAAALDKRRSKPYWNTTLELSARAFESYIIAKLQDQSAANDYLANVVDEKVWNLSEEARATFFGEQAVETYPYPGQAELPAVRAAFDEFFKTVETRTDDAGNVAMFSRSPNYDANVDAVLDGRMPESASVAVAPEMPVLEALGLPALPVATTGDRLAKMHFDHGLTRADLKAMPDLLASPVMVFESATQPGSKVLVLDLWRGGKPVVAAVRPNELLKRLDVNLLVSAYPKDRADQLGAWVKDGKLLYLDKSKSRAWATNGGVQFPWLVQLWRGTGKNLLGPADVVKPPAMSRGQRKPARVTEVQRAVAQLTAGWKNAPPVVVASSMRDAAVPQAVRDADASQRSQGASGSPEGFFYGGKVYLLADQLPTDADVRRVLWHESLGHYGLRGMFGTDLAGILDQIIKARPAELRAKMRQYGLSDSLATRRYAAEELLAEMAQTKPELGFVKRAIAAIRAWLKRNGFNLRLSDADIVYNFIAPARNYVERGAAQMRGEPEPAFTRSAINRYATDRAQGRDRVLIRRDGTVMPLVGIDSVDRQARDGEVIAQRNVGKQEWTVLSSGPGMSKGQINRALASIGAEAMMSRPGAAWYSELARQLDRASMNAAPAKGWKDWLKGLSAKGVKPDEIEWSGIREWLDLQPGKVTRAQIAEYLAANGVQVQEAVLGGGGLSKVTIDTQGRPEDGRGLSEKRVYRGPEPSGEALWAAANDASLPAAIQAQLYAVHARVTNGEDFAAAIQAEGSITAARAVGGDMVALSEVLSEQPGFDTTPAMREKAAQGMPLFSLTGGQDAELRRIGDAFKQASSAPVDGAKTTEQTGGYGRASEQHQALAGRLQERLRAGVLPGVVFDAVAPGVGGAAPAGARDRSLSAVATVAKRIFGHEVVFVRFRDGPARFNGVASDAIPGVVFINAESARPHMAVLGHELLHKLASDYPGIYRNLVNRLERVIRDERKYHDRLAARYIEQGVSTANVRFAEELRADIVGDFFMDPEFWRLMAAEQPGLFRRVVNAALKFLDDVAARITQMRPFGTGEFLSDIALAREAVASAMREFSGARVGAMTNQSEGVNLSVAGGEQFSIADALQSGVNNARDMRLPAGYLVGDFMESHGTLSWWDKTVGTPYNLAKRFPATFGRAYDLVQEFLGDVSYYATEAANKAPSILPKLDRLKDISKSPLSAADTKAIAAPIFDGTLTWLRTAKGDIISVEDAQRQADSMSTEDKAQEMLRAGVLDPKVLRMWQGMPVDQFDAAINTRYAATVLRPGVVWSPDELKTRFKLTGEQDKDGKWSGQIGLYQEFRAATDESLRSLAVSEMVRLAGEDGAGIDAMSMSILEASQVLRDRLFAIAEREPERADVLNKTADRIVQIGNRADDLTKRGYAPLSRFGHHTLDVVDESGERVYFGLFESAREANKKAREMRRQFSGARVAQGTKSDEAYKLFQGVNPETLELFGDILGLDRGGTDASDVAFQAYLKLATATRSALRRLIHRKGIAGFSEDAGRVLAGFITSNARRVSSNLHRSALLKAVEDIPQGQGELKDYAVRLAEYVNNPQEEAQALRGLLFAQFLGGSVASAMVNMTQPIAVSFPYLIQFGGARQSAAQLARAFKDMAGREPLERDLQAALAKAEEEGIVSPQEIFQLQAQARGESVLRAGDGTIVGNAAAKAGNATQKALLAWGKLFGWAEQINRRSTFIAAYRIAKAQGMANPAKFASDTVTESQFTYNHGNMPRWARGAIGATLFTFKTYSISYVELMARMARNSPESRRAMLLGLGVLFLMSGADELPFISDAEDVIDGFAQRVLGIDWSTKQRRNEFLARQFGRGAQEFISKGISGVAGVPIDLSGRLGMGDLIPGTGVFQKKDFYGRDALELLGPVGSLAQAYGRAAGALAQGEVARAVREAVPVAAQNVIKSADMLETGMYRDTRGRKVIDSETWEAAFKALGFQPNTVARVQDAAWQVQRSVSLVRVVEAEIADLWARGIFERDRAKIDKARERLKAWNKSNPSSRIALSIPQLRRRVAGMREDRNTRLARTAPPEIRARVREELGQ